MPLPLLAPLHGVTAPAGPRASMTEGPVGPMLARLTAPMAGGVLATIGYSVAETWFVGRLGAQALSAVGFTFPLTMAVISLAIGLGAGTSAVVARSLGAGEPADVTVLAPDRTVTIKAGELRSRSKNTPFDGWELRGSVAATIVGGRVVYRNASC